MPCFYPIRAWKSPQYVGGKLIGNTIIFDERKGDAALELRLPCGQCDGCRLERARQWATRCVHEASLYDQNCFITLTYNDQHLPSHGGLVYEDFQNFMKRFRKQYCYYLPTKKHQGPYRPIRYFMCGEYGEDFGRPHYHACIFNFDFDDRVYHKTTASCCQIFTSEKLQSLWSDKGGDPLGFVTIGNVDFNSAGYVARYALKKQTCGSANDEKYKSIDLETGEVVMREKEFVHMSLKPGIGRGFYEKWKRDIYPHDFVVVKGVKTRPPKYYYKLLDKEDKGLYDSLQESHCIASIEKAADNTEDRLASKEIVQKAAIKFLKRELS